MLSPMLHSLRRRAQTRLVPALLALLVAGCAGLPRADSPETQAHREEASRSEAAGDWDAAAQKWLAAAELARSPEADLIEAAEAWLRARQPERAQAAIARLPVPGDPALATRRAVVEADLALRTDRPADAREMLADLPSGPGDPGAARILALRAEVAFALREAAAGVQHLVARETLLDEPGERAANQRHIWNRLQEAVAAGAPFDTPRDADAVVAGWLALARDIAAAGGSAFRLQTALAQWRESHPAHPAATGIVDELIGEYRAMTTYPRRVALLLPLSGRHAAAAAAVRDGFVAGYLAQPAEEVEPDPDAEAETETDPDPETEPDAEAEPDADADAEVDVGAEPPAIHVYDTVALGTTTAYERAIRQGAEFVVGPLLKEEIGELAAAQVAPAPTLLLNWAEEGINLPGHVFQFALAPEDEAAAAARRVIVDGRARGVALVPDTDQGRRMAESFSLELQAAGGQLLDWALYDPSDSDFSAQITRLLLIDESRARHQSLQSILGRRLEFEPRRRHDASFLFLAARATEGRLIRPQLRFHYAADLPVYATSVIYEPGHSANADLDGILLDEMPWRAGTDPGAAAYMKRFEAFGPDAVDRNGRLFAFGADAWRLIPLLNNRSPGLIPGIEGLTGVLSLDGTGRVRRDLAWARIASGRIEPLPEAPAPPVLADPGLPE
jgi:hypothetical protein